MGVISHVGAHVLQLIFVYFVYCNLDKLIIYSRLFLGKVISLGLSTHESSSENNDRTASFFPVFLLPELPCVE